MVSGKVRDGILGKLIFATIAISAYVVATGQNSFLFGPTVAGLATAAVGGLAYAFYKGSEEQDNFDDALT
jgi:phage-related minor tail protein